jgi:phospholipid-binding lipoprotein MlaA
LLLAVAGCAMLALGGCAAGRNPTDPFEPFNRGVTDLNEHIDSVVLKPVATVYREQLPPLARTGVSNFFGNLGDAWSSVNSLLQFKLQNAAEDWMRFSVNTVFGFAGVLDIASEMNIDRHREDFGQTLGRWGVPAGPYVVLPFLGPSTLRDTFALPVDWQADPVYYFTPAAPRDAAYVLRLVDVRSNLLRAGDVLEGAALDKYSFTRDAYLQRRRAEIFEGGVRGLDGKGGDDEKGGEIPQLPPDEEPPQDAKPSR